MTDIRQHAGFTATVQPEDRFDPDDIRSDGPVQLVNLQEASPPIDVPWQDPRLSGEGVAGVHTFNGIGDTGRRRGRLARWIDTAVVNRVRVGGTVKGMNALVLTTIGASGVSRRTPVLWFPDGPRSWLIVAAATGAAAHPAWYDDITVHPNNVRIFLAGRAYCVAAERLDDEALANARQDIVLAAPRLARYERRTRRGLPVTRLTLR